MATLDPVREAAVPGSVSSPWVVLTEDSLYLASLLLALLGVAVALGVVFPGHAPAYLPLPLHKQARAQLSRGLRAVQPAALASLEDWWLRSLSPWHRTACLCTAVFLLVPPCGVMALACAQDLPGRAARKRIAAFLLHQPHLRSFLHIEEILATGDSSSSSRSSRSSAGEDREDREDEGVEDVDGVPDVDLAPSFAVEGVEEAGDGTT